jgi:hypothetical protein
MAAHVITALTHLRDDMFKTLSVNWPGLQAAVNLSCWTEQLEIDDYQRLDAIIDETNIMKLSYWMGEVYEKYWRIFEGLGKPTTMEEWVHRSWLDVCATQVVTISDTPAYNPEHPIFADAKIPPNTMLWVQLSDLGLYYTIVDGSYKDLAIATNAAEKVEGPHVF